MLIENFNTLLNIINRSDITIFNVPGGSHKQTVMIDVAQANPFASSYISRNPMVGDAINIKENKKFQNILTLT